MQTPRRKAWLRRHLLALGMALALLGPTSVARAQGPQFDIGDPTGKAGGASLLGAPLGAASFYDEGAAPASIAPISGRAGLASHAPLSGLTVPGAPQDRELEAKVRFNPGVLEPAAVPAYGDLDLPTNLENFGPPDGMTISDAIELALRQNLALLAMKMEIPMAQADLLTASLRANPIFYADTQLVPYGHFSFLRPGGPPQSDININYPLDVTRKRRARTASAAVALKGTEAQFQDAVRQQVDNLYTVYVDVVAARLTRDFSLKHYEGVKKNHDVYLQRYQQKAISEAEYKVFESQKDQALIQIREAAEALAKTKDALVTFLNLPVETAERLDVRDAFRDLRPLPATTADLTAKALAARPDMLAIRLGLRRAEADVKLAKANRYPDVYLLYQPYTFQNNTYLGVPSAYSWTLGATASIPLYNRNQGNLKRAQINVHQTAVQVAQQERQVMLDVKSAVREFEASRLAAIDLESKVVPASKLVRDTAYRRWQEGQVSPTEYFDAQKDFNEVVRTYRDALIRHRRAMLDLNTAVGLRVLP